jgi:hypothetical protein
MVTLLVAWGLFNLFWGELIPYGEGFGSDGVAYRLVAEYWPEKLPGVNDYLGQRCLPSLVVHYSLHLLDLPLETLTIQRGYIVWQTVLLVAATFLLLAVCDHLRMSDGGKWLMFVLTFVSFANLKVYYFNLGLTDPWAFALGAFLFFCYVKDRPIGMAAVLLVGPFVWPVLLPMGALLFLFPPWTAAPGSCEDAAIGAGTVQARRWVGLALFVAALTVSAAVVWGDDFYGRMGDPKESVHGWTAHIGAIIPRGVMLAVLPVSMALLAGYVALAAAPLLVPPTWLPRNWRMLPWLLPRVACLAGIVYLQSKLTPLVRERCEWHVQPLTPELFFKLMLVTSFAKPLLFLVGHFIWYGPVILVAILRWPEICAEARKLGPGVVLVLLGGLVMSINPESRQSCTFFPFFAVLAAKASEDLAERPWRVAALGLIALLVSRIWMPLNTFLGPDGVGWHWYRRFLATSAWEWCREQLERMPEYGNWLPPNDSEWALFTGMLAMNTGNQMNDFSYGLVAAVLLLTWLALLLLLRTRPGSRRFLSSHSL